MSKQEVLYETNQYFTYKGKKLHIRFIDEYFDMVPRPIDEEKEFLKQDIKKNGLSESIKINPSGIVLDGHTRIEICEELRWIKDNGEPIEATYKVKEFKNKKEEQEYVLKINLMRRQLNTFQKVRLVAKLYQDNPHTQREQNMYDILLELKKLEIPVKIEEIKVGLTKGAVGRLLKLLKDDFCASYELQKREDKTTQKPAFLYYILPKGEEILSKGRPSKITFKTLGKSIGVQRDYLSRAVFLINHANERMLNRLENGQIGIMKAYVELTKEGKPKRVTSYNYLKGNSKVICPHCDQISMKKEWKIYGKD